MAVQVTAAIIRRDGLFLLAKRKPGKHMGRKWEFPGGKIDSGETPSECLSREMAEEFGTQADVGPEIWQTQFSNTQIELKIHVHAVELNGPLRLHEHEEIRWVAPAELESFDLVDSDRGIARALAEGRLRLP